VITVREEEKNILQHCLKILIQITLHNKRRNDQTFNREFRDLKSSLDLIVPIEEHDYVLSDQYVIHTLESNVLFIKRALQVPE
jgi:hypothetical protein